MRKTKLIIAGVLAAGTLLAGVYALSLEQNRAVEAYNQDNLIRIHIVPHSDEAVDQELKHRVRKQIVQSLNPLVRDVDDAREARRVIRENLDLIKQVSEGEVAAAGRDYPVEVAFGRWLFPTRDYDGLTLAAGEYQAVRVTLGAGEGDNWWCVLFPPLCFVNTEAEARADSGTDTASATAPHEQRLELKLRLAEAWDRSVELAGRLADRWYSR